MEPLNPYPVPLPAEWEERIDAKMAELEAERLRRLEQPEQRIEEEA